MTSPESPFFDIPQAEWIAANRSAFAIWDGYPVKPGHALVCPRRQITDWWEATPGERADIFDLVDVVRDKIDELHGPTDSTSASTQEPRPARRSTTCTFTSSRGSPATCRTLAAESAM